jgi:hypothetical protein
MVVAREAACHCGQLQVRTIDEPFAVSICHCLDCQRRTGSAFGMQAGFAVDQVSITGRRNSFSRVSDEADRKEHVFHFCPDCGSQVFYTEPSEPDLVVVSVGSFADPAFPPPTESGYESRRHRWIGLPESIQRSSPELWEVGDLYEARRYTEAADRGRVALAMFPDDGKLLYNVACCEALAGEAQPALEHLRRAIGTWDGCREMANGDADFAALRDDPAFVELTAPRSAES